MSLGEIDHQKVNLFDHKKQSFCVVGIGEQIQLIKPEVHHSLSMARTAQRIIKECGEGPFVLQKITSFPRGRILLKFLDQHGRERTINRAYLTAL